MTLEKDDPKLTAYALGELSPAERAQVEAALAADPALRAEVDAIQGLGAALGSALQAEPAPRLAETQRAAIESRAGAVSGRAAAPREQGKGLKILLWTAVPGALAAGLLVGIMPMRHDVAASRGVPTSAQLEPMMKKIDKNATTPINGGTHEAPQAPPAMPVGEALFDEVALGERERREAAMRARLELEQRAMAMEVPAHRPPEVTKSGPTTELSGQGAPAGKPEFTTQPSDPAAGQGASGLEHRLDFAPMPQPEPAPPEEMPAPVEKPKPQQAQQNQNPQGGGNYGDRFGEGKKEAKGKERGDLAMGRRPAAEPTKPSASPTAPVPPMDPSPGGEEYQSLEENPFVATIPRADNLSTFSIDVDRAGYSLVRRWLTQQGTWPPAEAVRIEELVNYFPYGDAPPAADSAHPFAVNVQVASCPWKESNRLVRIGLKGRVIQAAQRPAANLVFLIDVSGSMDRPNRLPLVAESLKLLTQHLNSRDQVAIVVYAGASGLVLPITSCDDRDAILGALSRLKAGGSTNGGAGIELAYSVAQQGFIQGGTNRVVLCTDGDFNVGIRDDRSLVNLIQEKAKSKVFLTVLGFGMGNLKDGRLEQLADKGNGNYGFIDTLEESKKLLVDELSGTLVAIAKDVKLQVDFNWSKVAAYRLIGYENRKLAARDFKDDTKDAGEIGAGHAVTALYEVTPIGATEPGVEPSEYSTPAAPGEATSPNLLTVRLRYKQPEGDVSTELRVPVVDGGQGFSSASADLRFAASVAAFGMVLRRSQHAGSASLEMAKSIAQQSAGNDPVRRELIELIEAAARLQGRR